jgi:hypothetical protein
MARSDTINALNNCRRFTAVFTAAFTAVPLNCHCGYLQPYTAVTALNSNRVIKGEIQKMIPFQKWQITIWDVGKLWQCWQYGSPFLRKELSINYLRFISLP